MNKIKFSKGILLLLLNGTIALSKVPKVKTEEYLNPQNNKFTATDNLNMRSYNSKDSERIGKIKKNEEVEVLVSYDDDWDIVRYKDKIGFVNREFLNGIVDPNFDSEITLINGYVTATEDLRLRITPDTENEYIGNVYTDQEVEVIGVTNNNWFLVRKDEQLGFISGEYCIYTPEPTIDDSLEEEPVNNELFIYSTKKLNFREIPDLKGKKITLLDKGTKLKFIDYLDTGWFFVEYDGQYGYVSADYTSFNNGEEYRNDIQKVICAKTKLKLRSQPNTESDVYYTLNKYETCEVLRTEEDWYLVRVANKIGYVKKEYTEPLTGKFIVVDISNQTLTLYENNTIILETPVVTGEKYYYDTPTGKFEIKKKETDTYLIGDDYYTHVNYWMPFNGGIGLHDASWRSKFGGNIYVNNGSHGCVNIPPEYADDIFEIVNKGTKVLVQK